MYCALTHPCMHCNFNCNSPLNMNFIHASLWLYFTVAISKNRTYTCTCHEEKDGGRVCRFCSRSYDSSEQCYGQSLASKHSQNSVRHLGKFTMEQDSFSQFRCQSQLLNYDLVLAYDHGKRADGDLLTTHTLSVTFHKTLSDHLRTIN